MPKNSIYFFGDEQSKLLEVQFNQPFFTSFSGSNASFTVTESHLTITAFFDAPDFGRTLDSPLDVRFTFLRDVHPIQEKDWIECKNLLDSDHKKLRAYFRGRMMRELENGRETLLVRVMQDLNSPFRGYMILTIEADLRQGGDETEDSEGECTSPKKKKKRKIKQSNS